ncbi:MAG: isoprenylcysteine carboxylmethyltransferase family protein [candidate division Zixibacteria bacterium]|nr:isoprenylcysteine carboxylmethyltransferase family protein [candidate division Zixibacteria bacterium]
MTRNAALIKTILFTFVAPGSVTVLFPYLILSSSWDLFAINLGGFHRAGVLFMATGFTIYLFSAFQFVFTGQGTPSPLDAPPILVAKGIYRYVRNPMYVGVLTILFGEIIYFQSGTLVVYALLVFIMFNCFLHFYEEKALTKKFGESFLTYKKEVPRWIPFGLFFKRLN